MGALTLAVVETSICSLNWDKIADWRDGESLVTCHCRSTTGQHSLSEECGNLDCQYCRTARNDLGWRFGHALTGLRIQLILCYFMMG